MTSDNLPPQPNSHDAQPADGGGQPSDGSAQAPAAQYPQASVNTGEYRRPIQEPSGSPTPAAQVHPAAIHAADTGPLHQAPTDEATAGPWQPRPSGALAAAGMVRAGLRRRLPDRRRLVRIARSRPGRQSLRHRPVRHRAGHRPVRHRPVSGRLVRRLPRRSAVERLPLVLRHPGRPADRLRRLPAGSRRGAAGGTATATKPRTRNRVADRRGRRARCSARFRRRRLGSEPPQRNAVADSSLSQQSTAPVVADSQPVAAGSVESVAAKLLPSVVSILSISSSAEGGGLRRHPVRRRPHPDQQPRHRRRHRPDGQVQRRHHGHRQGRRLGCDRRPRRHQGLRGVRPDGRHPGHRRRTSRSASRSSPSARRSGCPPR